MDNSRRKAIKLMGLGGAAAFIRSQLANPGAPLFEQAMASEIQSSLRTMSPMNRLRKSDNLFSGDDFNHLAHDFLWNNSLSKTQVDEKANLVIVGGGISGLLSAYLLREFNPIVIERAPRLGGHSQGESFGNLDYSIGAAYLAEPDPKTELGRLLKELSVHELCRTKSGDDPILLKGNRANQFWNGETDPLHQDQFKRIFNHMSDLLQEQGGLIYPEVPNYSAKREPYIQALDRETFRHYLERILGQKLHSHVETAIEHYCWSSCGASMNELSAASALSQYAAEFGPLWVPIGGNGAIAERILARLLQTVSPTRIRTNNLALQVRAEKNHAFVTTVGLDQKVKTIRAKAVVMACPKFIVSHVLKDIETERKHAIQKLKYRPYLVANLQIAGVVKDEFFDLFLLGDGHINSEDPRASSQQDRATDVVLANYAKKSADSTVLTIYRPLPYDGARSELLPLTEKQIREEFQAQITSEILPALGFDKNQAKDLRIARWGHAMPVATAGLIADGTLKQIQKPFRRRVFFVEQDNWMQPALETCALEALRWSKQVRRLLKES